jgi:hypothetical protein
VALAIERQSKSLHSELDNQTLFLADDVGGNANTIGENDARTRIHQSSGLFPLPRAVEVHEVPGETLSFAGFPFRNSFLPFNRPCWDEQIVTSRVKSRSIRHLTAPLTWEEIMALVRLMVWVCAQVTTRIYVCITARAQQRTHVCVYTRPRACVVCMYHTGWRLVHTPAGSKTSEHSDICAKA